MEQPNLDYFEKLSSNNLNFMQKLIDVVKFEFPSDLKEYHNFIQENQLKNASEAVHKLKNKIGAFGMEKSYVIAQEYEYELREGNKDLQVEFEAVIDQIKRFIDQL
ncbi:Hpt domain-containing protein [Flavobacterium sp.]|uniref:Hpt domain-containing protein n=1 Tax=Flavobacterium sp. TaxID=239 RepID=UPI0025DD03C2|nr:Hpt domain-containing protein [Flavobacterium sp.]